jgi:hypothetical protein
LFKLLPTATVPKLRLPGETPKADAAMPVPVSGTLAGSAAPANVQILLLQVLGVGAVILLPSLLFLFGIFGPRGAQRRKTW